MRTVRLDVREYPPWQRHPMVFAAFDGLEDGDTLVLVNDHEPRPLRRQFEELRVGQFSWAPRNLGNGHWEVDIRHAVVPFADTLAETDDSVKAGIKAVFSRCTLFADATRETRDQLVAQAFRTRASRGVIVMPQGEPWPYVGVVCEGALGIIEASTQGRELQLYEALPLETFGEIAAVDDGATLGRATVISRSSLVALVPRDAFMRAFARDNALARASATICAQRFRSLTERFAAHVSQPTLARVAAAILPYAPPDRGLARVLPPLDELSATDIATAAGTVREVVGRALSVLERGGAIERSHGRIVRVDRERLIKFI